MICRRLFSVSDILKAIKKATECGTPVELIAHNGNILRFLPDGSMEIIRPVESLEE